jgi:hypothetical protein
MARDDDRSLAPYYIGAGVIAAAAVGYVLWRYVFRDEKTRERAYDALKGAAGRAADMGRKAAHGAMERAGEARDVVRERFG